MYKNKHQKESHKNIEYPIFHTQTTTQNVPKVIKVVNLKRFLPEAQLELTPKFKISRNTPDSYQRSSNVNNGGKKTIDRSRVQNAMLNINKNLENQSAIDKSEYLDVHQTQMLGNASKIKFRNCSHSHEELTILHECVDETLVKVGDTFDSRESFKQYLNDNAKRWHYYYVCRNSKKKVVEYNCICMAYNIKQKEVVIRKQKTRTTACPCKIRLAVSQTTNKLIVYYVCNHHDHPTTASSFHHYPHAKYLPQHVKEEFLDLTYLGLEVDLIQKYVHSAVGLTIKKKDIWSYAYRFKRKIFKRSISKEREKYIECLITKIRESYGESLHTKQHELECENSEVVLSIKEVEFQQGNSLTTGKEDSPVLDTLAADLTRNYSEDLLKEVLGDTPMDTEVIVQYVTEDGILCDENGTPVTNSSAIMQFVNNYSYVPVQDFHKAALSELDSVESVAPIGWQSENTVVFENEACTEIAAVVGDDAELDEVMNSEGSGEDTALRDSYEKRLSPTPDTPAVYAEMENFRKYYYVDHRYLPQEDQKRKEKRVIQDSVTRYSGTDSTVRPREEFIKAPLYVHHPSPIRHCTGHDHLTLLTDDDAIYPGAKFLAHDVFLAYINERAHRWFFYYSMAESGRTPENYVYKCVYGKGRVSKNAYRARGLRKRNKLTTHCPCQIRLRRLEADPDYLTVLFSCNHHDHDLDSRQFNVQPHSRRLPLVIKEEVKDLITLGVGADVLRKYVLAETGVRVYGKYFHNVRAAMRARGEQRQYGEERLGALTRKIRDLETIYGTAAKENPQANIVQIQPRHQKQPSLPKYCEISDRDDFAEEVCIVHSDAS